jgi:carboxypeptidase Taq
MKQDLGLDVPDDRRGCLQDVHWSMGSIGYFPTYTLGNLYAGQFWEAARGEIPDLDERMGRGEFSSLLSWLRERIHRHGRRYRAVELCERLTGKPLGHEPLIRYLDDKLRPIYRTGA